MSNDTKLIHKTFVTGDGALIVYQDGNMWRYRIVVGDDVQDPSADTYINHMCAYQNGKIAYKQLVGKEFKRS